MTLAFLGGLAVLVLALVVASFVFAGIGNNVLDLAHGAGWWSLLALAFPALVAAGTWRDRR